MDLETLRTFCLSLPGTKEDVKWEADLCFQVADKMFCVTGFDDPVVNMSIKVSDTAFEELIQRQGIRPAPYLARNKWVLFEETERTSNDELMVLISSSYELIKSKLSKKQQKLLDTHID